MVRPTRLLAALLALIAAFASGSSAARAGERIVGPGYAFDLPERFEPRAGPPEMMARATCKTLVRGLPCQPEGEPRMQFYAVPGPGGPEAVFVACRFDLPAEGALTSVQDLPEARVRATFEHTVDTLAGGKLVRTQPELLGGSLPAVLGQFGYVHPAAGERTVHAGIVVSGRTGLLLLVDAPRSLDVEYAAYFASIGDSLRMLRPAPGLLEQLRYPLLGLGALLVVLLVISVMARVRRTRRLRTARAAAPPRMRVISVDGGVIAPPGAAPADAGRARPAGAVDDAAPAMPRPAEPAFPLPAVPAGAAPMRSGLRSTRSGGEQGNQPALEPSAMPARGARDMPLDESEPDEAPAPKSSLRIKRNADFL